MNRKERRQQAKTAKDEHLKTLAMQLAHLGQVDDAIAAFRRALKADRHYADGHYNLGVLYEDKGLSEDAAKSYRRALALEPQNVDAHFNLGNVLNKLGMMEDAIDSFQKAVAIEPDFIDAQNNLGNVLKDLGRLDEAVGKFEKVLALNPDYAQGHNNLGNAYKEQNNLSGAEASYRNALDIKPDYAEAFYNLGNTLQEQGRVDDATDQFDLALAHAPDMHGWKIRKALLLPIIQYSEDDIEARRKVLSKAVQDLQAQNLKIEDPIMVGATNFNLSYHHHDNKKLMQDIAMLYVDACPKLTFQAAHCQTKNKKQDDRLRIGFLSSFFYDHTIGKLCRGIIEQFSRDKFEVIVFAPPGKNDAISDAIKKATDKVVPLNKILDTDREIIADQKLDILFYPDIGMDPYSYFLSFARLAPVQAISWGHPDTTGIPNIDYFISSDLLETTDSDGQYSEQLVRLSTLPTYYHRPEIPKETFSRSDFGFSDNDTLYVCPQALFKFHPMFDKVLGELLQRDTDGRLILIDDGKGGYWNRLLIERVGRACPDIVDRVIFLPRMPTGKFMSLLKLADAVLDVPTFSGGNSSMEAFAMGAPIVTWPGDFMRSRVTAGCYKQMGLNDLIAHDAEIYTSLAIKLAHDADFKSRMQDDIKANSHKLFDTSETVRELENFFIQAS